MFLKVIYLDENSYIEFSDRITSEGTKLQMSMRGIRDSKSTTLMSTILEKSDAALMISIIQEWLSINKE